MINIFFHNLVINTNHYKTKHYEKSKKTSAGKPKAGNGRPHVPSEHVPHHVQRLSCLLPANSDGKSMYVYLMPGSC